MKALTILFFLLVAYSSKAQFATGFDPKEATEMMALNTSFTFISVFNTDSNIIPKGYKRIYKSGIMGLDNQYQIWTKGRVAVISFRGSTSEKSSWLENLYSAMIPSTGTMIPPGSEKLNYCFAKDTAAHVHSGWTLGVLSMANDLTYHIQNLNQKGIYHIILTGHSQGGALAHLARAYFENLPKGILSSKNKFKTLAFASPMPGNKVFAGEYNNRYAANQTSFSVFNPKDMVTSTPFTLYNGKLFDPNELSDLLLNSQGSIASVLAMRVAAKWFFKDPDAYYIEKAGVEIEEQVRKKIGPFQLPKYVSDQSYTALENRIVIGPFEDVMIQLKKDSVNMDSLRAIPFYDKNLIIQSGSLEQHKPFNYYLYMLKTYFPDQYVEVKEKFRVIN